MRFFVAFGIALLGVNGLAMAEPHDCAKTVTAKMAQLDVLESQIKRIVFVDITEDGRSARLQGYDAWVDLKQCRGSVVMKMSPECEIKEIFSRGACEFAGLKNYR